MSLINEALKKAQQERAGVEMAPPEGGQGHADSSAVGPGGFFKMICIAVFVAIVFGGAVAFLVVGMLGGDDDAATAQVASSTTQDLPSTSPPEEGQSAAPLPSISYKPSEPARPEPRVEPEPPPAEPAPKKTILGKVRQVVATGNENMENVNDVLESVEQSQRAPESKPPQISTPPPRPAVAPKPKPTLAATTPRRSQPTPPARKSRPRNVSAEPDPAILAYVEALTIKGIKLAGNSSKVLMENKVYRLNSIVNHEFRLRVLEIKPQQIIFVGYDGVKYTKFF